MQWLFLDCAKKSKGDRLQASKDEGQSLRSSGPIDRSDGAIESLSLLLHRGPVGGHGQSMVLKEHGQINASEEPLPLKYGCTQCRQLLVASSISTACMYK